MTRFMRRQGGGLFLAFVLIQGTLWAIDIGALTDLGKRQYEKGEYSKALQTFLKLKKEDSTNPVVREYISKCTEKIAETETEARIKKAALHGQSSSAIFLPKETAPVWAVPKPPLPSNRNPGLSRRQKSIPRSTPSVPSVGLDKEKKPSSFLIRRDILAEGYKRKTLDGDSVQLVQKGGRVEVIAYMNRLFLPFSDSLSPDAVPALEAVSKQLNGVTKKIILLRAIDSLTPAVRHQMFDLPTRRMSILFSYFVHASVGSVLREGRGTLSPADLDD